MSKRVDIRTNERYMTEINAIRHYLSLGKRALKEGNWERAYRIWEEACRMTDTSTCYKCIHDDIGYCGLRRSNMQEREKFMRFCFPSVLKRWEDELKEIDRKKRHGI